jgi:hypothetical protein
MKVNAFGENAGGFLSEGHSGQGEAAGLTNAIQKYMMQSYYG